MNKICELRKSKGISQQTFANDFKVDRSTISKWETGESNPTAENLIKLAAYYGCTTDYLLGLDSGSPGSPTTGEAWTA